MIKRLFDLFATSVALIILLPLFFIIALLIVSNSKGGVYYKQERIGKNRKKFTLYKFRSMKIDAHKKGLLTVGENDKRITSIGYYLRKYKLDELPQLLNILKNDMSLVGPRPEVEKYVDLYNDEQLKVLEVKPGLTDLASLVYINENEILAKSEDPEKTYIHKILPQKLSLNLKYIEQQSFWFDLKIIFRTLRKIIR
ncbi:MAG: sugar transferase [Vicingaceae bacterium]